MEPVQYWMLEVSKEPAGRIPQVGDLIILQVPVWYHMFDNSHLIVPNSGPPSDQICQDKEIKNKQKMIEEEQAKVREAAGHSPLVMDILWVA